MLTKKENGNKRLVVILIKCLFAASLLYYLTISKRLDFKEVGKLFEIGNPSEALLFLLPFLLMGISAVIASYRLSYIINSQHGNFSMLKVLKINMIGLFFNNCLPGASGGDIVKS